MLRRDPLPDDLPGARDLVDGIVEDLLLSEARHRMRDVYEQQRVAVRQSIPVVMLARRAARRLLAPLPLDGTVPVELGDRLVAEYIGAAGLHARVDAALRLGLEQHVATLASGIRR